MYVWNYGLTSGIKEEDVYCSRINSGAFDAFYEEQNIKGIFCGHDHDNDYSGIYKNIELVYGRKTGYGSYGPKTVRGATVIELEEYINE